MQRITFIILLSFILTHIKAEELILTPQQIESIFLEKNLELIAEKLNISIADAALAEAKVWDNPEITVSNINIWQKGKPKQFSAELSQMFSLSARRAKLADVERIGKVIKQSQFEELLRSLKVELRNAISELYYTQNLLQIINEQKILTSEIVDKCQKQSNKGNISKAEIIRFQTALFELEGDIYEIELQFNSMQKDKE